MTSITYFPVSIQASADSVPSLPCWFGEVTLLAQHLHRQGVLAAIEEQVRFARRRFGRYEVIDFVAVLFGYAISGERTLEAFYERLSPWAAAFMALFGRDRLPARSTLSRFLASLDQAAVEALRTLASRTICWLADWSKRSSQADCGTDKSTIFSSSIVMAHERRPANGPCRRQEIGLRHRGACARSVLPATPGASAGKWSARAARSCKPIPISGSAASATQGTVTTGRNCVGQWPPFSAICKRTSSRRNVPWCGWMGNMVWEPSLLIWQAFRS